MSILTCVTGYWVVKNKYKNKYKASFDNTLRVNAPYIMNSSILLPIPSGLPS